MVGVSGRRTVWCRGRLRMAQGPLPREAASAYERIIAATAALLAEHGYGGSERSIRARAQVTCAQFHEQFADEHAAFMATMTALWAKAMPYATNLRRMAEQWLDALVRGVAALMDCLASDEVFTRLAFTETLTIGGTAQGNRGALRRQPITSTRDYQRLHQRDDRSAGRYRSTEPGGGGDQPQTQARLRRTPATDGESARGGASGAATGIERARRLPATPCRAKPKYSA